VSLEGKLEGYKCSLSHGSKEENTVRGVFSSLGSKEEENTGRGVVSSLGSKEEEENAGKD
jgi:hypothetical protein